VSRRTDNLLRDLAALLTRHRSREWVRLADLLENDEARSQVVRFLREISSVNHTSANQSERKGRARAKVTPRKGKKEYVEPHDLELSRLSISELRELLRLQSLSYSNKDSRQRLIGRLLKGASGAPPRSRRAAETRKEDPSDYAQWAEIIMGRSKGKD
jgi:hypothetical protein